MADLSVNEFINGTLATLTIVVALLITTRFFIAYKEYKRRELLLIGFVSICMAEAWMPVSISFIYYMITNEYLPPVIYFFIGYTFLPVGIFLWLIIFTNLIIKDKQKVILFIYAIYIVYYEVMLWFFLITDPLQIGTIESPVDSRLTLIFNINAFGWVAVILSTGIIFARESIGSSDPTIRVKGWLLLIGFITWSFGALLDGFANNIISLFIVRFLLMLSVAELYGGFMLPDWMKKLINKLRRLLKLEEIEMK